MLNQAASLFNKVNYNINKQLFNKACRQIRSTPPIYYRYNEAVKIVTMVQHQAVDMYLLAIKSFLYNILSGSVFVLDDGSLTEDDYTLIKQHIPDVTITHINKIDTLDCPKGGTWERLIYLIELSKDAYVIQLDSDTFTLALLSEVYNAIENQQAFVISGGPAWDKPVNIDYLANIAAKWVKNMNPAHVQPMAESFFNKIDFFRDNKQYIRGCSAFTGLPKQQISKEMAVEFSRQVSNEIGLEKWSEWGSEQVTSNVMASQTKNPIILPWPLYQNYGFPPTQGGSLANALFVHFIGSHRFSNRIYQKLATDFINTLNKQEI